MNTGKRIPATLTAILAILALTACGETPSCPVCGQWWQLDLPDGDFWEPISTLKAFLQFHPKWKAERKHRKARI